MRLLCKQSATRTWLFPYTGQGFLTRSTVHDAFAVAAPTVRLGAQLRVITVISVCFLSCETPDSFCPSVAGQLENHWPGNV